MIRIAVVGAGHWGPNLIRNLHNPPASSVVWIVDKDPARLKAATAHFPEARVSRDPSDAFADEGVRAVVIATPTTTHYALAKAALERGKDVLIEKPMTGDVRQAESLRSLAARKRRLLMVGHVFLFNAGVRHILKCIQGGMLGRLHYISMVRTNLGPLRMDVNAAWDLAAHDISIADYWTGATPLAVSASGGCWINRGIEDAVFATLRYPRDILVNIHASWLNPRKVREATVIGEQKMLTFDDMNPFEPVRVYDKHVAPDEVHPSFADSYASFRASVIEGDVTIPRIVSGEPLRNQCQHFVECLSNGTEPLTGAGMGAAVVRTLCALQRSLRAGGREISL